MLLQKLGRGILALLLLLVMVPLVAAQEPGDDPVQTLIERLSPEQKVGQLVLVSFPGTDVENEAAIRYLVEEYGVGGVLLRAENGNFGPEQIDARALISMTNSLQAAAWEGAPDIPLFVAVGDDNLASTRFISGTSTLPTGMALGATWSRALSEATGQVVGRELSAVGINLYLGPSLNVLYEPQPGDPAALGTDLFGGAPYWVSEIGRAYVRGLHQGSDGVVGVIPRHFPGLGSADRPVREEVPTIQKSLAQLQQIDLVPFQAVAEGVPGAHSVADGFLVTHARYRGLQGSVRLSTRPVSLDAQALTLALQGMESWRTQGGLLVAENLGVRSLRRFDDPWGLTFNARRIARDALLAGNDLLVLDRFAADESWERHFYNVQDTLEFLTQRYESDPTFQERVDEALYRIIALKMRLYPRFSLSLVQRESEDLAESLGQGQGTAAQVANSALTRLVPASDDLLPPPPQDGHRFVIFSEEDARPLPVADSSGPVLPANLVGEMLLRLYGPEGTGQIRPGTLQEFTFADLRLALETPVPEDPEEDPAFAVRAALAQADWIIFAPLNLAGSEGNAPTVELFLEQQASLLEGWVVVFDFGAPYGLDSTEISKIDLYYALYSPGEAFVQAAARAFFRDLPPAGSPPVSIPALSYDLAFQIMPAPEQTISLFIVNEDGQELTEEEQNDIRKDDIIYLRTSVIKDRNAHPVPDGTPVEFILTYPQEDRVETIETATQDGVALTTVSLDRVGQLDVTVKSEPVLPFYHLQLTVRGEDQGVGIEKTTPTPEVEVVVETPPEEAESRGPESLPDPLRLPVPRRRLLLTWGILGGLFMGFLGFVWGWQQISDLSVALRIALWVNIGGLFGYTAVVAVGRWLFPGWIYQLAGREIVMGAVAMIVGGGVLVTYFGLHRMSLRAKGS